MPRSAPTRAIARHSDSRRGRLVLVRATLALLLIGAGATSASAQQMAVVRGRVLESGTDAPVANAVVLVRGTALTATTDTEGRFSVRDVPATARIVAVRGMGWQPTEVRLGASDDAAAELIVYLLAAATRLSPITVRTADGELALPADRSVSSSRLTNAELLRAPGAQDDALRALSVLPGVAVTTITRNDLAVRGGAPFENLFMIDDLEVPNISHFGTQGSTGGPLTLIHPELIRDATLSTGGFGVRHGDRTASVTSLRLREGRREGTQTQVTLAATGAGVVLEGPLGSSASYLVASRRSYLDLIFNASGFTWVPSYTDVTTKLDWRPGHRDHVSVFAAGGLAQVQFTNATADARFENSRFTAPEQQQYFAALTWTRSWPTALLTTTLGRTWSRFDTVQRDTGSAERAPEPVFVANTEDGEFSLGTRLTLDLGAQTQLEAGALVKHAGAVAVDATLRGALRRDTEGVPHAFDLDTTFSATRGALYASATHRLGSRVEFTGGMRVDRYGFLGATRVAPRASLRMELDPASALTLSMGRYWQAPQLLWLVGDAENAATLHPFRADQAIVALTRALSSTVSLQVEAYAKRYAHYPVRVFRPQAVLRPGGFDDVTGDIPFGLEPLRSTGTGRARGLELLVRRNAPDVRLYGLLSASINRTRFTSLDGSSSAGAYEVPYVVTGVIGWRPGERWEFSSRARVSASSPTTPFVTRGVRAGSLDFTRYQQGDRLPSFAALDLRMDRRWVLGHRTLLTYLDVQNVTGRHNPSRYVWNPRGVKAQQETTLGIVPNVGVTLKF